MISRPTLIASVLILLTPLALARGESKSCPAETADCLQQMTESLRQRGWLGIKIGRQAETGEAVVSYVFPGSPAETADLRIGDHLLSLNGMAYSHQNEAQLRAVYKGFSPGDKVTYGVRRGGEDFTLEIELAALPESLLARWVGQHLLQGHTEHEHSEPRSKP